MRIAKTGFLLLTSLFLFSGCNEMDSVPVISGRSYLTTPIDGVLIYDVEENVVYFIDSVKVPEYMDEEERLNVAKEEGVTMDEVHFVVTGDKIGGGTVLGSTENFFYLEIESSDSEVTEPEHVLTYRYLNDEHNWGDAETPDVRPAYEYYEIRLTSEAERVDEIYYDDVLISSGTSDFYDPYHKTYIQEGQYINVNVSLNPNRLAALLIEEVPDA